MRNRVLLAVLLLGVVGPLNPAQAGTEQVLRETRQAHACAWWQHDTSPDEYDIWAVCADRSSERWAAGPVTEAAEILASRGHCYRGVTEYGDGSVCDIAEYHRSAIPPGNVLLDSEGMVSSVTTWVDSCSVAVSYSPTGEVTITAETTTWAGAGTVALDRNQISRRDQAVVGDGAACAWAEVESRSSDSGSRWARTNKEYVVHD
jgi:hypothetical protein